MPIARDAAEPFGYCLNTSTIKGQKLSLEDEITLTAEAGYEAIEPWIGELDAYAKQGKSYADLKKRIADAGLKVAGAIGFFEWVLPDETRRKAAFEEAKRNFDQVAQIGGTHIAAPPWGHQNEAGLDLQKTAEYYRELCELGDRFGVVPLCEFWGFSKSLSKLSEGARVVIESGHPKACLLADVYHMYKGGSAFEGLRLLNGQAIQLFHVNDYPADPPRASIVDKDRVFPGDGVAPLAQIFGDLKRIGYTGFLSLELFNETYWQQDALSVAKTGLEKLRAQVRAGCGG